MLLPDEEEEVVKSDPSSFKNLVTLFQHRVFLVIYSLTAVIGTKFWLRPRQSSVTDIKLFI